MAFENIIELIIERAKETENITAGDYVGEDNLYYCGKCHTRKQTAVELFGNTRVVPCICQCRADELKAEE